MTRGLRSTLEAGLVLALVIASPPARADGPPAAPARAFDRTVVRYYAPEMGDTAHPHFVYERVLAFEARLEVMAQGAPETGEYAERNVRAALDHHLAEEMLSLLADKLVSDSPADKRPTSTELDAVRQTIVTGTIEALGGRDGIDRAARLEGIDALEVDAMLERSAMAAWYLDRAVTPILHPSDDQLRDVFRTSEHPYRGQPYERVRPQLERWFVLERLHVAEGGFLQAARSRLRVVVTP